MFLSVQLFDKMLLITSNITQLVFCRAHVGEELDLRVLSLLLSLHHISCTVTGAAAEMRSER